MLIRAMVSEKMSPRNSPKKKRESGRKKLEENRNE
jgi:hypothetical protein